MMAVSCHRTIDSDRNIVKLDEMETNNNDATLVEGSVGRMTPMQPKPIEWISVLGERNSGTRWLYE
jgi:dethiobiotin synthetase